ncbi:heterokaryon incompatibility protein-domain-containing protein [Annulohypoxylon truncatum]|uniref:heterokaryon incompatibility protein-domain-containing protein n=1 Tax=Annulohypoxylon truncatum TaxID=327061 RepID=UPI002008D67D|nr:heterokaryon incompatibility protein-domain-containing protein [Annulohypoxylon truncatum]KAI1208239.1 heterokaryon incompatibility protein-domain-containing protein [Annulohypoxylon truncatum]
MDASEADVTSKSPSSLYISLLTTGSKCIRVLDLEAPQPLEHGSSHTSQDRSDELRGQLRVVDLADNPSPKFIALSYVWGPPSPEPRTIKCGQHSIPITDNCWEALSYLRVAPDFDRNADGSLTLWIDAICINQADEEEKLNQIPLMGSIYSQAVSVCVWLGPGTSRSDEAMDYLKVAGFQEHLDEDGGILKPPKSRLYWKLALTMFTKCQVRGLRYYFREFGLNRTIQNPLPVGDRFVSPGVIADVLERPWIGRIWTLQEVLLASRIRIQCGTKSLEWHRMLHALTWFAHVHEVCAARSFSRSLGLPGFGVVRSTEFARWQGLAQLWMDIHIHPIGSRYPDPKIMDNYRTFIGKVTLTYFMVFGSIFWALCSLILMLGLVYAAVAVPVVILGLLIFSIVNIREYGLWWKYFSRYLLSSMLSDLRKASEAVARHTPVKSSSDTNNTVRAALIREIWHRAATDPRDKSYGVHSILHELGVQVGDTTLGEQCNELYRELFVALLWWTRDPNILLCASGPKLVDQPSWVPDWHGGGKAWFNSNYFGIDYIDMMQYRTASELNMLRSRGNAGTKLPGTYHVVQDDMVLSFRGMIIGSILWVSDSFGETSEKYSPAEDALHMSNIAVLQSFYMSFDQRRQVPYGTPSGIMNRQHNTATQFRLFWTIQTMSLLPPSKTLERIKGKRSRAAPELSYFVRLCYELASNQRSLFKSSSVEPHRETNLYGHCPQSTEVGDVLVILEGVDFPAVLRKQNQHHYRLVGFAMVDDYEVMDGYIWNERATQNLGEFKII